MATRTKPNAKKTTTSTPVDADSLKKHQINIDEERWEWLQNQSGGASKEIRDLIDAERFRRARGESPAVVSLEAGHPEAPSVVTPSETPVTAPAVPVLDAAAYLSGADFHGSPHALYRGPVGWAVNKRAEHMAKVVYEPAHENPYETGARRGQGRDYATWVFAEEPGLREFHLESGLELLVDAVLEPDASVGVHHHRRTEEIYYVLLGSLSVTTIGADGREHRETLGPGDAHLVKPGQAHTAQAGPEGARFIALASRVPH